MKKLILIALFVSMPAYALTGFLNGESSNGQWKYCSYSNGKVITIKAYKLCPLRIN